MMHHPKMKEFDDTLKSLFDEIDCFLEDRYGDMFPLHPNRMKRDTTSNPEMDGLFNVGVNFSAGYGSELGRGYVLDLHLSTLAKVPKETRGQIEEEVIELIKQKLPVKFPERDLSVDRDGNLIKIHGDFSLGIL